MSDEAMIRVMTLHTFRQVARQYHLDLEDTILRDLLHYVRELLWHLRSGRLEDGDLKASIEGMERILACGVTYSSSAHREDIAL
jgi:hypothetical protein